MTPPRFQYTIRGILWATFWVAVSCMGWTSFIQYIHTPNAHDKAHRELDEYFDGPYSLEEPATGFAFATGVGAAFVAIGALLGRAKLSLVVGVCLWVLAFIGWMIYGIMNYTFLT